MANQQDAQDILVEAIQSLSFDERKRLAERLARMAKAQIPGGITLDHYKKISEFLLDVREATNAMQVVARLNETRKEYPAPVFVGWVEDHDRESIRRDRNEPEPGLLRFGDTAPSTTYERCYCNQKNDAFVRNWNKSNHVRERRNEELCLSYKAGVNYLLVVQIIVKEADGARCVGVLGAGFSKEPDQLQRVEDLLKKWAQQNSPLVNFLQENFELGGRVL